MQRWLQITVVISSTLVVSIIVILIIRRCFWFRSKRRSIAVVDHRTQTMQSGIQKLHQVSIQHLDRDGSNNKTTTNHYVLRHGVLSKRPLFSWDDHPLLITDAVENGWPRFAFTTSSHTASSSASSIRSTRSFLSSCAVGDQDREMGVEINWEVSQASSDFMQKIRFINSVSKKSASISAMASKSVVRTALPLPGPLLKTLAFPQEAYFEITILPLNGKESSDESIGIVKGVNRNSEKAKLITEDFNAKTNPELLIHGGGSGGGLEKVDEFKAVGKQVGKGGNVALSVGLGGGGGPLPFKLPGSYAGSIGFNSNGSVYLDGIKLVPESEKEDYWGEEEMVIGCGYNPAQKKVFFTVDSQLVHEIHCKSEEFGTPLYPILAANIDVTVLINLGQCVFKYLPANLHRTQNPCFIGPMTNSPSLGYDDSKELFSMGRIDSHWYNRSTATRSNNTTGTLNPAAEFDGESEGDLFEIVLDNTEKSHYYG